MSDVVDWYLTAAEYVLLVLVPVLAFLAIFGWVEAYRLWPLKLPTIIALSNTMIGAAASWLAWVELYRQELGIPPAWFAVVNATAIVVLCAVPSLSTAYLVILEARRRRESRMMDPDTKQALQRIEVAVAENTAISQEASNHADAAYREANTVNQKIAALGLERSETDDRMEATIDETSDKVDDIHDATVSDE